MKFRKEYSQLPFRKYFTQEVQQKTSSNHYIYNLKWMIFEVNWNEKEDNDIKKL
jgi:hypothetical protein